MKYKEFDAWCNERARDGCWGFQEALICIDTVEQINAKPFWKREKAWQKLNSDSGIVEKIVNSTNKIIEMRRRLHP